MNLELRGGRYERVLHDLFVPLHQGCGLLQLALELQVLRKIADHVDLVFQVVKVLLLIQGAALVGGDDLDPEADQVILTDVLVQVLLGAAALILV